MNLMKLTGFFLLSMVFVSAAMAADKAPSAASPEQPRISLAETGSDAVFSVAPPYEFLIPRLDRTNRSDRRVNLNPLAGVCFTMRSYKVKRTERFRGDGSAAMAYSTCQLGSGYNVRSAGDTTAK